MPGVILSNLEADDCFDVISALFVESLGRSLFWSLEASTRSPCLLYSKLGVIEDSSFRFMGVKR